MRCREPVRLRVSLPAALRRDERGVVAVVIALSLGALVAATALAVEIGRAWNLQTELQSAADAAALAGASQLDRKDGARERARTAAKGELARNRQTFASDGAGVEVTLSDDDIRFLEALGGPEAGSDEDARFIEVTTPRRRVDFSLAALVGGPLSARPKARAVAGLETAMCKVPPLFFCLPAGGTAALTPGTGVWLKGKNNGDTSWGEGNFGILGLNQFDGSTSLSASLIRDAMARVNPLAECFSPDGTVTTKPGQTTTIRSGLNMRFDIYPNANMQVPDGEPPVMQNPEYRPSANTVKGLMKAGGQCALTPGGWELPTDGYDGPGAHPDLAANPIGAMGFPRDNCAYPASATNPAGGTCIPDDTTGAAGRFGDGVWDVGTYLRVNHPGMGAAAVQAQADDPANGYGNGDGKLSRYEVHQWEIANAIIPNDPPVGERGDTVNDPICYAGGFPLSTDADRRVLTVAVLDCSALAGTDTVEPAAYYNFFLTEPIGVFGEPPDNKSIYGEIVGPADATGFQAQVAEEFIQLYE